MANIYVRSTDGSDADNGSTWALAKATLAGAAAIVAGGDTIYVSHSHAESTASAVSITLFGSAANPIKVLCVNDGAEPPTALATTATVTTTGNSNYTVASTFVYIYGITFTPGSGASGAAAFNGNGSARYESCNFHVASTATSAMQFSNSATSLEVVNCGVKFGAAGSAMQIGGGGLARFRGCSLLSGGTSPTSLFTTINSGSDIEFDGFDLTNAAAGINIFSANITGAGIMARIRDCRMPGSWSGALHATTPGAGAVLEMFNCDSGDTHYRYRKAAQFGTIQEETTLVRTGGASDGTTTYSLKMVTNANAEYPMVTLDWPEFVKWNDTTGSGITVTVEFLHDSATNLKDNEIWLEVMYLGTSGVPLGAFINDGPADVLATAADQADSSATWTTTGMANPNTQKMSVTFTPQEAGYIHAVVKVAKASYTVYADYKLTVS